MIKIDWTRFFLDKGLGKLLLKWHMRKFQYLICGKRNPRIVIPMIRKIMPHTIAQDLVGVQPMAGPAPGQIFKLNHRYADDDE